MADCEEVLLEVKTVTEVDTDETADKEVGKNDNIITEGVKPATQAPDPTKRSKRSLKREKKWLQIQQKRKEHRKEEKKRRTRAKREQGVDFRRGRVPLADERASRIRVVLDCAFDDMMTQRELEGLAKQIKYCYASNRASIKPVQLHLCGYAGGVKECLSRSSPEHNRWDIHLHNEDITKIFTPQELVYLTADSDEVIREVSEDKCYVVGGLLDHNRHKGACLDRAKRLGMKHGRLVLDEVVKLNSRTVLTVNHVFDVMLRYASSGDWKESILGALPPRKIDYVKQDQSDKSDSEGVKISQLEADTNNESIPN